MAPTQAGTGLPDTLGNGSGNAHTQLSCPACGRAAEPELRFCAKCGFALNAGGVARPVVVSSSRWWHRFSNPEERQARRAYRHSLPPLYRWRRVMIGVLTPIALMALLAVVGKDPAGWAKDRWHDAKGDVVQVFDVKAAAVPRPSALRDNPAANLVDNNPKQAWATRWVPTGNKAPVCGGAPNVGQVQVTLPPTRIRQIRVRAGVNDPSQQPLQFLPATLHVTLSDKTCRVLSLKRTAQEQMIDFDSETEVTSVRIGVASAIQPPDPRAQRIVAISELSLWSRP
jgi:hypothetical protein